MAVEIKDPLADLNFQFPLRRYQQEILELIKLKLERGEKNLHIVAPPGAGKTIIGLQIIAELQCSALVLCPNTTIQAQWGQKLELFLPPERQAFGVSEIIGTHEDKPLKPITLLTYQVLSTPGREVEYLEKMAHQSWLDELTRGLSLSTGEGELRILELMQNNKTAYQKEMSRHISRLRRRLSDVLNLDEVLHENAIGLIQSLRRQKFQLVLFDECHHLTDYWAAIMTHLVARLDNPVIVGLTGTPPEGKTVTQETRYLSLVGDIDYQVPTPALVKEGGLAPYQDLVMFTEPTEKEMAFLETQHEDFHELLEELSQSDDKESPPRLATWILDRLHNPECWNNLISRNSQLAFSIGRYLWSQHMSLPKGVDLCDAHRQALTMDDWIVLLEDFSLHYLKVSPNQDNHLLLDKLRSALRKLGYALTEQGIRKQATPVDRILAYSQSKVEAAAKILDVESTNLGDRLRAVVVTDFERMAATSVKTLKGVLDTESGGAVAILRGLLQAHVSQYLSPCLVTGSLLLIDSRIADQFYDAAQAYIAREGYKFQLTATELANGYTEITASSSDWETRLYVAMATELFERGITKCLVGTRGIFGEGWDSQSLNTLIDLTTTTSPVSIKQLRGRSIRLKTNDPLGHRKVANNWDVVCIAPSLEKGLNDFHRFVRKQDGYFGICDDGQIECGVGHVHAAFSELTPAEVFASSQEFNLEMIQRALVRDKIYDLWKVGQPYFNRTLECIEVSGLRKLSLTPPFIRKDLKYKNHASSMRVALNAIWWEYLGLGASLTGVCAYLLHKWHFNPEYSLILIGTALLLAAQKHSLLFKRLYKDNCEPNTQESSLTDIAIACLVALQEIKLLPKILDRGSIKVSVRADGSYRVFIDNVSSQQSQYFAQCMSEVLAPITNQPYLIPKYEYSFPKTKNKSASEMSFFKTYLKGKAEPKIGSYHAVPKMIARSEKGREAFQVAWNKYVSPGFIVATETKPELLERYFGMGPSLAERLLWE